MCAWMVLTPAGGRYGVVFLRGLYIAVLGPVLFLIFINDIDSGLSSNVLKFADDTKVFSVIDSYVDGCGLQADLRNIEKWAELWQMEFNVDKCKVVHYGKGNIGFKYDMYGHQLQEVIYVRLHFVY